MPNEPADKATVWAVSEQIAAFLREGILNGDFPPGSKLPSSRKLTEMFGAAAQTIRNAVTTLEKEGLATAVHGSGVIVRPHRQRTMTPAAYKTPAPLGEKYQWLSENEKRGFASKAHLLDVEEVAPPAAVRETFELADGETVLLRRQVLTLDGEPCELVEVYIPMSLARGTKLMNRHLLRGGSGRVLEDLGHPTVRCVDKVSSRLPTREQYAALKMPTKLPVLRTYRTTYSTDGRPIQVEIMAKAGHMYELQYEF
ncbi:GntR family transcriptional regulator [Streptomyces sp. NPDC051994]|uniref:GntR family transcriptional regulator n=1 Tax=unclassified Streptomyces TaxID=2593676 RepID=UPI00342FDD08